MGEEKEKQDERRKYTHIDTNIITDENGETKSYIYTNEEKRDNSQTWRRHE